MRLGVAQAIVDHRLVPGDVEIVDGLVVRAGLAPAGQGTAIPGFVDLQVNGFAGVDFVEADSAGYRRAGEALLASGVTAFQPTFITAPEDSLLDAIAEMPVEPIGPRVIGAHLEGPFLSPLRMGAHTDHASRRDPDLALLDRLLSAGRVSQMTLAPELPGALALIAALGKRGVVASCGHSNATAAQAIAAFDHGVSTVTHLFNAMRPFSHRDPGIAGAALARKDVIVQVILDGHHLADETASLIWRAAAGRTALVTDAIAAAGAGDGLFRSGGADVFVEDGAARLAGGTLAGATLTMIVAMRRLCSLGVPLVDAAAAATRVPAAAARRPDLGILRVGHQADVVVLDDRLEIRAVFVAGREELAA
jgi:N-acetylglucosamine-6-phosphate deacetylase